MIKFKIEVDCNTKQLDVYEIWAESIEDARTRIQADPYEAEYSHTADSSYEPETQWGSAVIIDPDTNEKVPVGEPAKKPDPIITNKGRDYRVVRKYESKNATDPYTAFEVELQGESIDFGPDMDSTDLYRVDLHHDPNKEDAIYMAYCDDYLVAEDITGSDEFDLAQFRESLRAVEANVFDDQSDYDEHRKRYEGQG